MGASHPMKIAASTVTLRPAQPNDAGSVAAVWESGWPDGHRGHVPIELERHRTRSGFVRLAQRRVHQATLAVDQGLVVGFVIVIGDELEQLYVAVSSRGGGVADRLIAHAEEAIAKDYSICWLAVASGNARARRFYERSGCSDSGPLDYSAEIDSGHITVPTRRYQKQLAR
jgi:ribosomal protein S18 acetylase RimI-like enzyme